MKMSQIEMPTAIKLNMILRISCKILLGLNSLPDDFLSIISHGRPVPAPDQSLHLRTGSPSIHSASLQQLRVTPVNNTADALTTLNCCILNSNRKFNFPTS